MTKNFDRFLLGILWLLAVMLAACFWFNTMFAFNLFSAAHWRYLAGLQASQITVSGWFYISLVITIGLALVGTNMLMRPRLRKIRFIRVTNPTTPPATTGAEKQTTATQQPDKQNTTQQTITDTKNDAHVDTQPQSHTAPETAAAGGTAPLLRRPARLNVGFTPTNTYPAANATPIAQAQPRPAQESQPAIDTEQIERVTQIFESAGYLPKGTPRIKGMQTCIVAIGTDEVVWIGSVGADTDAMNTATDTMRNIFMETLDDIDIKINAFIINAPDADTTRFTDILQFADTEQLAAYMADNPNATLADDDIAGFDAFSAYMSTVIDYIGKI